MAALQCLEAFTEGGGPAYNQFQSAQPQTLAYALQDSPAGWLAWVCRLLQRWVGRDDLSHASASWLTSTIGSSIRRFERADPDAAPAEPTLIHRPSVVDGVRPAVAGQPIATMRSIGVRARSAISRGTCTTGLPSRSASRSFGSVIIFM